MPASVGTKHTQAQRRNLLERARASIAFGLRQGRVMPVDTTLPDWLQTPAASFVTLTLRTTEVGAGLAECAQHLRGCIGSLHAYRSLAEDVTENAYAAAFRDPRFPPVNAEELLQLRIEISLLSTPQPLPAVASESELLALLQPGRDGVVLQQQGRRATFLPKVWEHFVEPVRFLQALRQKAGLVPTFDPTAQYLVYQAETFAEP